MSHVKTAEVKPTHLFYAAHLKRKTKRKNLPLIPSPQSHKQAAQLHNTDMQRSDWVVLHLGWWGGGSADGAVGHREQPMSRQSHSRGHTLAVINVKKGTAGAELVCCPRGLTPTRCDQKKLKLLITLNLSYLDNTKFEVNMSTLLEGKSL